MYRWTRRRRTGGAGADIAEVDREEAPRLDGARGREKGKVHEIPRLAMLTDQEKGEVVEGT